MGQLSNPVLGVSPDRKVHLTEPLAWNTRQKVGLIFVAVNPPLEPRLAFRRQAGVVSGGNCIGTAAKRGVEKKVEFDLGIAERIGIRSPPALDLGQKTLENAFPVLVGARQHQKRNAERRRHARGVTAVFSLRAT